MRKDDRSVENYSVNDVEGPQVVLQPVPHQDGVGIDEAHQIILYFLQILCLTNN